MSTYLEQIKTIRETTTDKIGKIIKTTDTLQWERYEPSQDTRQKYPPPPKKKIIHKVQVLFYHW
jgi:hypothetical protein